MEGTTAKAQEDTASAQAERLAALLPLLSAIRTFDGPTNPSGGIKTSNEALQRFARACGDPEVKQAFERAAELEKADSVIVPLTREEEERYNPKRRRITKDDHVDVPPPTGPPPLQPLAPVDPNEPILTLSNISQYLQHTHTKPKHPKLKVQIWLPSQTSPTGTLPNPVTLKLTHSNLFFVYISCLSESTYGPLRIRKVVVFGPREKRLPHMQSEYMIFRTMSQVLAKVVDQAPDITLPQLMDLISSYDKIYSTRCSVCHQTLSKEGHLPPLERLWETTPQDPKLSGSSSEATNAPSGIPASGNWVTRHLGCQY